MSELCDRSLAAAEGCPNEGFEEPGVEDAGLGFVPDDCPHAVLAAVQ